MQAMSQYTRKNFVYQLVVHKIFPRSLKDLNEFKSHVISFTDMKKMSHRRGLRKAFTYILPVHQRIVKVDVDIYSIRKQYSRSHEWPQIER